VTAEPILTLANQLTLLRLLLIPAFVLCVVYGRFGWALVIFAPPMRSTASSPAAPTSARRSAPGSTRPPTSCCW
jgi:hypothetical protein